jgi:hypothetical protein
VQTTEILSQIALGTLLGLMGQGIRVVIGLKKQSDEAAAAGKKRADNFDVVRLCLSLAIGAIAGSVSAIILMGTVVDKEFLLTIITSGYAGTDFVEGTLIAQISKDRSGT